MLRGLVLALLLWAGLAQAQDAITERAALEDPGGTLTLAQAQASTQFSRFDGPLRRGFSASVFWVRLRVQGGQTEPLALRIQPGNLDEITVFDAAHGAQPVAVVGDRHEAAPGSFASLVHTVLLPAQPQARWLWLRLATSNTKLMAVQVLPLRQAQHRDQLLMMATSLLISTLTLFTLWAALNWWWWREPLIGVVVLTQASTVLYALAYLGYLRLLLGGWVAAAWLDQITNVLVISAAAAHLLFHSRFLRELGVHPRGVPLLAVWLWLYPLELLALALGYTREALLCNALISLIVPPVAVLLVLLRRPHLTGRPLFTRGALLMFYLPLLAVIYLSILPILGLPSVGGLLVYSLPVYGFVNGLMMMWVMVVRAAQARREHGDTRLALRVAETQMAVEVAGRREQSQFMDMLTHELKTPLAVLRMALGLASGSPEVKARADRAIHDMTGVIDRCAQASALDDGLPVQAMRVDVAALLAQIVDGLPGGERVQAVGQPGSITTDPTLLRSVLGNLLDNALKYAAPGTAIDLQLAAVDGGLTVRVSNAPGRAGRPDAQRVFQKYYRSAAAQYQSGSGLGLYLAATLAARLGGRLSLAPDESTVSFTLWLPC